MLLLISLLWLMGFGYTVWKRWRQNKKFEKHIKSYIDEQERQEQEIREAEEVTRESES